MVTSRTLVSILVAGLLGAGPLACNDDDDGQGQPAGSLDLRITGTGFAPHNGEVMSLALTTTAGQVLTRGAALVADGGFAFTFPGSLERGLGYRLDYYTDHDHDGVCTTPVLAGDHGWTATVPTVTDAVTQTLTHNVIFGAGVCASFPTHALTFSGTFAPHAGRTFYAALVRELDGFPVATTSMLIPAGGAVSLLFAARLQDGLSYHLDYFVDANANAACETPALTADQGWRIAVPTVSGDVTLSRSEDTTFEPSVCASFPVNGGRGTFVAVGTMKKGSIIINGVRFDDSAADITVDDVPHQDAAALEDGMQVTVRGSVDDNGIDGVADTVEVENQVRGVITSLVLPDGFMVMGKTVVVDGITVFANVVDFAGLAVGQDVEVHGEEDLAGVIRASRVEVVTGAGLADELRGVVAGLDGTAKTFTLGALSVNYAGAVILPADSTLADGQLVEAHGAVQTGVLVATRIDVENLEDDRLDPDNGDDVHLEGFVSGFTAHPGAFTVGEQAVVTTATTRFTGGIPTDLANDVKVEAEGAISAGVLTAYKIEFKDSLRLEANLDAVDAGARALTIMGKTVVLGSTTELSGVAAVENLTVGGGVRVRGFLNNDGLTLSATRVDAQSNPVAADRLILQGKVTGSDAVAKTIVVVGMTLDASGAGVQFRSEEDAAMTAAEFFAAITGTSIVKGRGTLAGATLTVDQLEFE
ncbi:MAG: hypothetical protein HY903_03925 [Deltaproteobacteria bacterium]|nr:hypothetical protein [Deltaproteobacteria bacterium]